MLRIVTFGEATISVGGEQIAPSAHRTFALALYLGAERGRAVPRSVLQAQLFGESAERTGSHNLRQLVYRLRLLGVPVVTTPSTLSLAPEHAASDYAELLDTPSLSAEQLDLVAKGFLPGYAPTVSDAYLEWVDAFRSRVTLALRRKALESMAAARDRCDWNGVARAAEACLALDPLNEDAMLGQAEALAMSGSKVEALERIERYLSELPAGADECRAAARRLRQRIVRRVSEPAPLALREMPLVGREEEMRRLTSALARTRSDGGGVVLLSGEPGIGKTRLLSEFERLAALNGAQTARVVCRASTSHQPLSPFIELTRMLLQMPGALGCSPEALERLRRLCVSPVSAPALPTETTFNPSVAFGATSAAIVELVEAVTSESPLVLAIDDAHWLDGASAEVAALLSGQRIAASFLMVLAGRELPDLMRAAARPDSATHIRVGPVSDDAALVIVRQLSQSTEPAAAVEGVIVGRAAGNPLFLQLLATHNIRRSTRDSYPSALTEILRSRLETIPEKARALLECSVLLGRHATPLRVQAALRVTPSEVVAESRYLEQSGLLYCSDGVMAMRHPLVASLVLEAIPTTVSATLHARIARLLQREARRSRSASLQWDVADHWERAGEADLAAASFRGCIHHLLQIGRAQDVVALVERCLALRGCSTSVRAEVLQLAAATYDLLGEWKRAADLASEYMFAASPVPPSDTTYLFGMSSRHATGGRNLLGQAKAMSVLADDHATDSERLLAASVLIAYAEDEFEPDIADAARRTVESIESAGESDWHRDRFWLIYHTCFGSVQTATELARHFAEQCLAAPIRADDLNRCFNLSYALVRTGQSATAKRLLVLTGLAADKLGLPMQQVWCRCWQAWIACQDENWSDAQQLVEDVELVAAENSLSAPPMHTLNKIELALARFDLPAAHLLLRDLEVRTPSQRCARLALHVEQLWARARLLSGDIVDAVQLQTLRDGHRRGRAFGMHDDVVATLGECLIAAGLFRESESLIEDYLRLHRRDPFPVGLRLSALTRSDIGARRTLGDE